MFFPEVANAPDFTSIRPNCSFVRARFIPDPAFSLLVFSYGMRWEVDSEDEEEEDDAVEEAVVETADSQETSSLKMYCSLICATPAPF